VVNLLALPQLSDSCIPRLADFLAHQYPTVRFLYCILRYAGSCRFNYQIRGETARYLYLLLQSRDIGKDTDDVEELLLETEWFVDWSSHAVSLRADYRNVDRFSSESDVREKAQIVVDKLKEVKDE
jgi:tubulin-specific chaperone D